MSDDALQRKLDAALARAREVVLREFAQDHRGELVDVSTPAVPVPPRRLDQVVSMRMDGEFAAELRDYANARRVSVSTFIREAAVKAMRPAGFSCQHATVTGPYVVGGSCGECGDMSVMAVTATG